MHYWRLTNSGKPSFRWFRVHIIRIVRLFMSPERDHAFKAFGTFVTTHLNEDDHVKNQEYILAEKRK